MDKKTQKKAEVLESISHELEKLAMHTRSIINPDTKQNIKENLMEKHAEFTSPPVPAEINPSKTKGWSNIFLPALTGLAAMALLLVEVNWYLSGQSDDPGQIIDPVKEVTSLIAVVSSQGQVEYQSLGESAWQAPNW